jgi:hypothetical protein
MTEEVEMESQGKIIVSFVKKYLNFLHGYIYANDMSRKKIKYMVKLQITY